MDTYEKGVVTDDVTLELAQRVVVTTDEECEDEYDGRGHRGLKVKVKAEIGLRDGRTLRAANY